jgi:hypothetical protein
MGTIAPRLRRSREVDAYLAAALSRGPSHIRIIAIGNAGQNMIEDASFVRRTACVGGVTTKGNSTPFAAVATVRGVLFLRACRRLAVDLTVFFADLLGRGILAFRICFCHV